MIQCSFLVINRVKMYQNACGAAAASAGGCVETDKDCHSLISKEPTVPVVEHDYSGFDIVKATQV